MINPTKTFAQSEGIDTGVDSLRTIQRSAVEAFANSIMSEMNMLIQRNKSMLNQNIHASAHALGYAKSELSESLTGHFGKATLEMIQRHKDELDRQAWFE